MTMQITSSGNLTPTYHIQPVSPVRPQPETRPSLDDILTPEQKNMVQQGVDDKIAEQVDQVKSNYQTAKDIDLMQSYYQQQQKLFDIYLQTSTESDGDTNTIQTNHNSSAVSALSNAYAELYELHQEVKEGVNDFPKNGGVEILPTNKQVTEVSVSTNNQTSSHKQMDAYNSLMMPSTTSYMHLSA